MMIRTLDATGPDDADASSDGDDPPGELHAVSPSATVAVSASIATVVRLIDPPDIVVDLPDACARMPEAASSALAEVTLARKSVSVNLG
jgi:hypothetical protein